MYSTRSFSMGCSVRPRQFNSGWPVQTQGPEYALCRCVAAARRQSRGRPIAVCGCSEAQNAEPTAFLKLGLSDEIDQVSDWIVWNKDGQSFSLVLTVCVSAVKERPELAAEIMTRWLASSLP